MPKIYDVLPTGWNWELPPITEYEGCHGDEHAFIPPPLDGDWHEIHCACGQLVTRGRNSAEGGQIEWPYDD